ncbi:unnamed protein product [Boreogadus saida]
MGQRKEAGFRGVSSSTPPSSVTSIWLTQRGLGRLEAFLEGRVLLWCQQSAVFSSSWSATPPVCLTSHLALIYNHAHLVFIPNQPPS